LSWAAPSADVGSRRCGVPVFQANFDDVHVVEATAAYSTLPPPPLYRPINRADQSPALHSQQVSSWIWVNVTGTSEEIVVGILGAQCRHDLHPRQSQYTSLAAQQATAAAGQPVKVGNGQFAMATGEAWRMYRCRRVIACGVNLGKCYHQMPIRLDAEDEGGTIQAAGPHRKTPAIHAGQYEDDHDCWGAPRLYSPLRARLPKRPWQLVLADPRNYSSTNLAADASSPQSGEPSSIVGLH